MNTAAWQYPAPSPDVVRLDGFLLAHPGVRIRSVWSGAAWQALWQDGNGETVTTRYTLDELLDKLDEVFPPGDT